VAEGDWGFHVTGSGGDFGAHEFGDADWWVCVTGEPNDSAVLSDGQGWDGDRGFNWDGERRERRHALPSFEFLAECLGKGVGLGRLPGIPAFAVAGVAPGRIGAQGGQRGVVGTPGEMNFHAVEPVVQPPGGGNGDCVTATIASAAEIGVGAMVAVMFVRPELQRGPAPWGGKFDFPTDCVGNTAAKGFAGGDVFPECGRR